MRTTIISSTHLLYMLLNCNGTTIKSALGQLFSFFFGWMLFCQSQLILDHFYFQSLSCVFGLFIQEKNLIFNVESTQGNIISLIFFSLLLELRVELPRDNQQASTHRLNGLWHRVFDLELVSYMCASVDLMRYM